MTGWPLKGTGFGTTSTFTEPVLGGSTGPVGVVDDGPVGDDDESLHVMHSMAAPHTSNSRE